MNGQHLDLFSGIGGFALAAKEAGFKTIAFCESDRRCADFLRRTWNLPVTGDIRELCGTDYRGISLLTGGPPCQPASRAGDQGGDSDDRWLWPEALRLLDEAKPDSVVFENPPGILDVGIDGILSEMGRIGYETQCFDIPACAVDSPQLRHRIWIVGFKLGQSNENGRDSRQQTTETSRYGRSIESTAGCSMADSGCERSRENEQEREQEGRTADRRDSESELADAATARRDGQAREEQHVFGRASLSARSGYCERSDWSSSVWVPCADGKLRRAPDDSFDLVDGLHRSLLGALGNSIVWKVAVEILKAVKANL